MSCEVKYIKENYSQHPEYEVLTEVYHQAMKQLVQSNKFQLTDNKLKWAKEGTAIRIKQNKIAQSVENDFNILVQDNKGNVVVNISSLLNQDTQFQKAQNIEGEYNDVVSPFEKMPYEEQQAFELSIRDLSARIADRIGIQYKIINDKSQKYKGEINNNTAIINLAYATLDTPIHEILGHPIIRAIKNNKTELISFNDWYRNKYGQDKSNWEGRLQEYENYKNSQKTTNQLYRNLLKELEYGKGKEVFEQVKRDYKYKDTFIQSNAEISESDNFSNVSYKVWKINKRASFSNTKKREVIVEFDTKKEAEDYVKNLPIEPLTYTLEEQQEEAIVELLGLMAADKLDNVKDGKLISLLKRLLKEMKQFVRSLLNQKEVEIDKLPDNMTLGDLSDLLAYSNSKLILPGYEVEYTTPDNIKFKTYQEASNHISNLANSVEEVDLEGIKLNLQENNPPVQTVDEIPISEFYSDMGVLIKKEGNNWVEYSEGGNWILKDTQVVQEYNNVNELVKDYSDRKGLNSFLEKNKKYEQSKEIIEEWKKVNNIQYNPEEIYSRGQEFTSVVGAYSFFDVNLMMQNLLSHIEDNEKAGGVFAISAYTKPIDKKINHLEGSGGKIKFKIYPKSEDILWASNIDVYSGSVWDASEKVNKDKKSELLGVSYTKYPSLDNVNSVQPNLASIVDDLSHHHNELAISLNFNNFEIEIDEDVPYQTKKIVESVNKILQQKRLEEINNFINKLEKEC